MFENGKIIFFSPNEKKKKISNSHENFFSKIFIRCFFYVLSEWKFFFISFFSLCVKTSLSSKSTQKLVFMCESEKKKNIFLCLQKKIFMKYHLILS